MPEATRSFVNQRTLKESHRRLVDILNVGNDVLDVGCSTGTITSGIAKMVQNGKVIGMDENKTFIKEANKTYAQQRNLSFIAKDIYEIDYLNQFDVEDRKSTRLNSSHVAISYAVFCLKKKNRH